MKVKSAKSYLSCLALALSVYFAVGLVDRFRISGGLDPLFAFDEISSPAEDYQRSLIYESSMSYRLVGMPSNDSQFGPPNVTRLPDSEHLNFEWNY